MIIDDADAPLPESKEKKGFQRLGLGRCFGCRLEQTAPECKLRLIPNLRSKPFFNLTNIWAFLFLVTYTSTTILVLST